MHKFLRAIGFTDFRKKDLEIITNEIIEKPEVIKVTKDSQGNEFAELSREFAPNIGLKVVGNFEEDSDNFEIEYCYPYINSFDKTYMVSFKGRNNRDCEHLIITNYPLPSEGTVVTSLNLKRKKQLQYA